MDPIVWIVIAVVAVLAVGLWIYFDRRRSARLRSHFGPEYEHELREKGSRRKAEAELAEREKRVEKFEIRPLQPAEKRDFVERWSDLQARFVDDPPRALAYADALIAEVMSARGYPVEDFEHRAGDISVDHPKVVEHYRAGHAIAVRQERGDAGTEELRQAIIHYRALFEELVEPGKSERRAEPAH